MAIAYHGHAIPFRSHARARSRPKQALGLVLPAGEHVLCRETGPGEAAHYVATERALYHRGAHEPNWERIAWIDLAFAEFSRSTHALVLRRWPGDRKPSTELAVAARSRLPAFASERIAACQIVIRHVHIDGASIVIAARREPGTDTTTWTAHVDRRREAGHPDPADVDRAVREIRAQTGC